MMWLSDELTFLPDQGPGPVAQFPTKCCNNLAIDYADQNYFASSALDQPGLMIWDRRAINRHIVTQTYADALETDNLPWGGALRLDRAVQIEADPALMDSKSSFIRSLRFCRDHPGMLAVLSRTGQLRILSTRHEHVDADARVDGSPELLEVRRSYEMDPLYAEANRKGDKIVSFDWVTMSSPVLQPRLLVLRASGAFDVLEKPSFTSEYPFKLIPWQPPYRGLEGMPNGHAQRDDDHSPAEEPLYPDVMDFEPPQRQSIFGPLLIEQALSGVALFGPQKANIRSLVEQVLTKSSTEERRVVATLANDHLSSSCNQASSIADKLRALRLASKDGQVQSDEELSSQLKRHEKLLTDTRDMAGLSPNARFVLDHSMLLRAKEGYRFDFAKNQRIVADDPWLQDVWAWVDGESERQYANPVKVAHRFINRRRGSCAGLRDDVASLGLGLHGRAHHMD
jgi:hypothetical protein